MGKILVTGASGNIGRLTIENLLKRKSAKDIVGLVRDPAKAQDLASLGIELRQGDYLDPASLLKAFKGVDKLQLTSTHAFTDRKTAHANVVDAAVKSGVDHIVYMPIIRKEGSGFVLQEVTAEDIFTEKKIFDSGLKYTLLKHPPFADVIPNYLGKNALEVGVRILAGNAKTSAASREDLAEAHAAVLAGTGHENKSYSLTSEAALSFPEMTDLLSQILGKKISYITVSNEEYESLVLATGVPDFVAKFIRGWVYGMANGEWSHTTKDLEMLIGRKPSTIEDQIRKSFLEGK
jgi:NAD(P)H dehydrogenase (quinone)